MSSSCAARDGAARRSVRFDDLALLRTVDRAVRFIDEARQRARMPVIAARLPLIAVHALLHHRPPAIFSDEEAVQIKIEAVLQCGAVDFCHEAACAGERVCVESDAVT